MPILTSPKIEQLEKDVQEHNKKIIELKSALQEIEVQNYPFVKSEGTTENLSDLFQGHSYLVLIHNMGQGCKYCTMWANGFEGIYRHFDDKAGFVLVNHDSSEKQIAFAKQQGWTFPIYSASQTTFTTDMGFKDDKTLWPGVSVFRKSDDGKIFLISQSVFGPGDNFCSVWHFYDMMPEEFSY